MSWAAVIVGGSALVGGVVASKGAKSAANKSAEGSDAAIEEQRRQYDQTRADQMPWLDAGRNALTQLQDPNTYFQQSPDYGFRRAEGTRGIEQSAAARGGAFSGNALKALAEYNSNLASGEFGNWFNRKASIAGVGQASANTLAGVGQNTAGNIGNALTNAGDARASGVLGATNGIVGNINNGLNSYAMWKGTQRPTYGNSYSMNYTPSSVGYG